MGEEGGGSIQRPGSKPQAATISPEGRGILRSGALGDIQGGTTLSEDSRAVTFSDVALTLISLVIALGVGHLLEHVSLWFSEADVPTRVLVVAQGAWWRAA